MTRHRSEEELVLHHYEPNESTGAHVAGCASCRERLEGIAVFLSAFTGAEGPVPERSEEYGRELFQRLAPRLAQRPAVMLSLLAGLFSPRRIAFAGGVLALVAAAFLAGQRWPAGAGAIPPASRERVLLVAVGEHLDRSQVVLLELLNSEGEPLGKAPERAEELVSRSRLYRQAALHTGDRTVAGVLDDLERLLLDVAHAPASLTAEERDAMRRRIEKNGLLFKVRVLGSRIESRHPERPESPRI